jgi:hypothetical protein
MSLFSSVFGMIATDEYFGVDTTRVETLFRATVGSPVSLDQKKHV